MWDILRESMLGEAANRLSGGRLLPFPEQRPDFVIPERYLASSPLSAATTRATAPNDDKPSSENSDPADDDEKKNRESMWTSDAPTRIPSSEALEISSANGGAQQQPKAVDGVTEVAKDLEAQPDELERALEVAQVQTGDHIIVEWYGDDDPENPQNWSTAKRDSWCSKFSVYIGTAIYTPSIPAIQKEFGVGQVVATLGLSLFIEGYALGPLIFSPLQELPSLGRNPGYIVTLAIFAILQIPTALAKNIGGLLVLRFLGGFFGSPALATGGATIGDMMSPQYIQYTIGLWALAAVAGPVLGPIAGGFAAVSESWRWPLWEILWISGFATIFFALLLPETLPGAILLKRAQRLRKLTGNDRLRSMSEIDQAHLSASAIAFEALVRPFELMREPAILFCNLYIGLAYAIFYLWFESFPLVFIDIYHFSGGISDLPFLALLIGACSSYVFYIFYTKYFLFPRFAKFNFNPPPEEFLRLSCFAGFFIPISLFIFGWSARESVHWIVPTIGAGLYMPGIYLLFQSMLIYMPVSYPKYAASLFAGNDFFRGSMAAGFPLIGRIYFKRLGLGGGSSLLAGVALLMIPFMVLLFLNGGKLRAMSKYTH